MADPSYIVDGVLDGATEAWVALNSKTCDSRATSVEWNTRYNDANQNVGGVNEWSQYMDFYILCYCRGSASSENGNLNLKVNSVDASDSHSKNVWRNATSSGTSTYSNSWYGNVWDAGEMVGGGTDHAHGMSAMGIILSDVNSGKYKTAMCTGGGGDHTSPATSYSFLYTCMFFTQEPIKKLTLSTRNLSQFETGSRFDLFGILPRMVA